MPLKDRHGTPPEIIDVAHLLMGGIDLDPCSEESFNQVVNAETHYSQDDDGMALEWFGRVFLNPPGGRRKPGARGWYQRLVGHYQDGLIEQAVYVAFSLDALQWSQHTPRALTSFGCVVLADRLKFLDPDSLEPQKSPWKPNAIAWLPPPETETPSAILAAALDSVGLRGEPIGA
jgi:hypothetical protein